MTEASIELTRALDRDIDAYEAAADQFGAIAADARLEGDDLMEKGLSVLARTHRIRALALRGCLATVQDGTAHRGSR